MYRMITISFPDPTDAEGMNEVIKASWYATYVTPQIGVTKEDIDALYAQSEADQIEAFRKRAAAPTANDVTLVAKEDGKVVGIIRIVISSGHVEVRTLYVHPAMTGKGIGTMLWNEAQKHIPKEKKVLVYPATHTRSIDWYKKMGFIETGKELTDEEAMPISGVRMEKIEMQLKGE